VFEKKIITFRFSEKIRFYACGFFVYAACIFAAGLLSCTAPQVSPAPPFPAEEPAPAEGGAAFSGRKAVYTRNSYRRHASVPAAQEAVPADDNSSLAPPASAPESAPLAAAAPETASAANTKRESRASPGQTSSLASAASAVKGKLIIIIDDAGYHNELLEKFLTFPGSLTIAVLPGLAGSAEAARLTLSAGKELMLHLPMEAQGGEDPGPGAILTSLDTRAIGQRVRGHIDSLPGIVAVNNHMGSRATEDERVMRHVLAAVKEKGLFFIDSLTTARSSVGRMALEAGLPWGVRDVFLDNKNTRSAIRRALEEGMAIAEKNGTAILIGHVQRETLAEVLHESYAAIIKKGFVFSPVSEILREQEGEETP
jgi:polysaccharide deacetylase 2 family uncharacterized protein YibQ